jgi:hypothetical protein
MGHAADWGSSAARSGIDLPSCDDAVKKIVI